MFESSVDFRRPSSTEGPDLSEGLRQPYSVTSTPVMPEQCEQKNNRQRNAEHPKKCASTKAHDVLLSGC